MGDPSLSKIMMGHHWFHLGAGCPKVFVFEVDEKKIFLETKQKTI